MTGFWKRNVTDNATEDRVVFLLRIIRKEPSVIVNEMAKRMNVTRRTILRDLGELKQAGKIRGIGSDKYGYRELT